MKTLTLDYYYQFTYYQVFITYKRMRNITYRYDADKNQFKVSAPNFTSTKKILFYLDKFAPSLLKKANVKKNPISENNVFVFGQAIPFIIGKKNKIYPDHIEIKKKEDLNKMLKKILLNYLIDKVKYYEDLMNTSHYKISIKNMRTRLGSNSRYSHRLSFTLSLVHYTHPVIDSVIIHELTHDKYFDHGKGFYECLYKYCPDYKALKKAIDDTNYTYGREDNIINQQKN